MSLIFHRFPSVEHAERFVAAVAEVEPELEATIYASNAEAQLADPFPYPLEPPIVHVERPYSGHDSDIETARDGGFADDTPTGAEREEALELAVIAYQGTFAGT